MKLKKTVTFLLFIIAFSFFCIYANIIKDDKSPRVNKVKNEKEGISVINSIKIMKYYKDFNPMKLEGINEISADSLSYPYISIEDLEEGLEINIYYSVDSHLKKIINYENNIPKEVKIVGRGSVLEMYTTYYLDSLIIEYSNRKFLSDSSNSYLASFSIKRWNDINDPNKGCYVINYIYGIKAYKIEPQINYQNVIPNHPNILDIITINVTTEGDIIKERIKRENISPLPHKIIYSREEKFNIRDRSGLLWYDSYLGNGR